MADIIIVPATIHTTQYYFYTTTGIVLVGKNCGLYSFLFLVLTVFCQVQPQDLGPRLKENVKKSKIAFATYKYTSSEDLLFTQQAFWVLKSKGFGQNQLYANDKNCIF